MPLNAVECPAPELSCCAQELDPEERSALRFWALLRLTLTVFPLTFLLYVFPPR